MSQKYFSVKRKLFKVGVLFLFVAFFSVGVPLFDYYAQFTIGWYHKLIIIGIFFTIPLSLGLVKINNFIRLFKTVN